MPVYELDPYYMAFPPADHADESGLLAIGGELREDWIILAYQSGIFPWFNEGDPVQWWSPDPRILLHVDDVKIQKSMRPLLNSGDYEFKLDTSFEDVISKCAEIPRHGQNGTWITEHMIDAYSRLHDIGIAHSAEVWHEGVLIGGLYGLSLGNMFFGESMFSDKPNASKLALIRFCSWLKGKGFEWIDCQIYSRHLERMGARTVSRAAFLDLLDDALEEKTRVGKWVV
ncbi:MAG: leucyl/phenylalanyl-tRNA--protein transferase [Cryomorphaceae bacterium]|nr:leucyl/phenylalanyl-tRNA--protein transferase [Flavobacteriales bacterium]